MPPLLPPPPPLSKKPPRPCRQVAQVSRRGRGCTGAAAAEVRRGTDPEKSCLFSSLSSLSGLDFSSDSFLPFSTRGWLAPLLFSSLSLLYPPYFPWLGVGPLPIMMIAVRRP